MKSSPKKMRHPAVDADQPPTVNPKLKPCQEAPPWGIADLSAAEHSLVAEIVADGLAIQDKFRPEPLYRQTGKGHYAATTVEDIRRAKEGAHKSAPPKAAPRRRRTRHGEN